MKWHLKEQKLRKKLVPASKILLDLKQRVKLEEENLVFKVFDKFTKHFDKFNKIYYCFYANLP